MRNALAVILALLGGIGCATVPRIYTRGPLEDKILRAYPGRTALVEEACLSRDQNGKCIWSFEEYDLNDRPTRLRLRNAHFVCNVGATVYRVAQELPGLILEHYEQSCFLGICGARREIVDSYLPVSDYQRLVDARTICFSSATFDYDSH